MDAIRSSIWSIIGLTSTAPPGAIDRCLPADLLANLDGARKLSGEISVAERNVDAFKAKMQEFGSAFSMTINDFSQLSSYATTSNTKLGEDLIAAAAQLQQQTSAALVAELTHRVSEPLARWRVAVDELVVQLEEQRRMHHQGQLLRDHIRAKEEGRVRLMKSGKWSAKDGADLKRAQDALVSWRLKTEAVDAVVAESVQRDLIESREQNGVKLLKELDAADRKFWSLGGEVCKLRTELIDALASSSEPTPGEPAPVAVKKKKKKKSRRPAAERDDAKEEGGCESAGVVVDNAVPDILSSFECLRYEPDPFSPSPEATPNRVNGSSPDRPADPFAMAYFRYE